LTLDDDGIPETSEGRVKIAEKIISVASEYGIERKNLIFDTLAMAISADTSAAQTTLRALREIKTRLHCHTLLGVSNISFGLPERETMTSVFFALALENGLSAAIMNPGATSVMRSYYSFCALHGLDASCADYIENIVSLAAQVKDLPQQTTTLSSQGQERGKSELQHAIVKGLRQLSGALTEKMITGSVPPLQIVNDEIIPALDIVGRGFEKKTFYLPQLLMSAEAASAAFECIKAAMKGQGDAPCRGKFVLATVHGDIHDIGKNIVKLLLENYGFDVLDLGKDVPPARVVEMTIKSGASLVGLSALMTTTVPAMEATIAALREAAPHVKIVVGGAVLTEEYAASIGADYYAKDAMATVRYALENCM
jgi:5-methyltetrahydrofolate--homocysteine methyltransferase